MCENIRRRIMNDLEMIALSRLQTFWQLTDHPLQSTASPHPGIIFGMASVTRGSQATHPNPCGAGLWLFQISRPGQSSHKTIWQSLISQVTRATVGFELLLMTWDRSQAARHVPSSRSQENTNIKNQLFSYQRVTFPPASQNRWSCNDGCTHRHAALHLSILLEAPAARAENGP